MVGSPPVELLIAATWGLGVALLIMAGLRSRLGSDRRARLLAFNLGPSQSRGAAVRRPSPRSSFAALGTLAGRRWPARVEQLAGLIDGGGLAGRIIPTEILGWKIALASSGLLTGLGVCMANWGAGLLLLPVLAAGGWAVPTLWLKSRRQARLRHILTDLPTVIDLLALGLDAGMGLDRAIGIICDRSHSPLTDELQRVLSDISIGLSRQEAFVRLSERCKSDDVRLLTSSIIQSEQLGSSLVTAVKSQARVLRATRRRRAETQALKAPVKMLFPMVVFILPTLFLFVLGPPALNLTGALSQGIP